MVGKVVLVIAIAIVIVMVLVIVILQSTTKIGSTFVSLNMVLYPQTKSSRNLK